MNGNIINISRFCTDDGPGIRTTVFLKGCPLGCIWCHNPESQKAIPEVMYDGNKCINCKRCRSVCNYKCHLFEGSTHIFQAKKCQVCGKCTNACPIKALEMIGKSVSADEVLKEVEKDTVFYQTSNGGVTISGGEPLFQPEFSAEILRLCKERGLHTAIETCGFASEKALVTVLEYCDLVLFDIKETDEEKHRRFTGVSFKPILENLRHLKQIAKA